MSNISRVRNRAATTRNRNDDGFDEYGSIPKIDKVYTALEDARSIIITRTTNQTVVAYMKHSNETSSSSFVKQLIRLPPVIPLGANQSINLVMTGVSTDCQLVYNFCQEVIANHTIRYGVSPSAYYLAKSLSKFVTEKNLMSDTRPLVSHIFLFDRRRQSTSSLAASGAISKAPIYEILPHGEVNEVIGSAAGKQSDHAKRILEEHVHVPVVESSGAAVTTSVPQLFANYSNIQIQEVMQSIFLRQIEDLEDSQSSVPFTTSHTSDVSSTQSESPYYVIAHFDDIEQ
eukprot:gene9086-9840_t